MLPKFGSGLCFAKKNVPYPEIQVLEHLDLSLLLVNNTNTLLKIISTFPLKDKY